MLLRIISGVVNVLPFALMELTSVVVIGRIALMLINALVAMVAKKNAAFRPSLLMIFRKIIYRHDYVNWPIQGLS